MRGLGLDAIASHDLLADRIRRKWGYELYIWSWFLQRSRNFGTALDNAFSDHRGSGFGFPHEGDLEKARYAREGSIKFVPDSFADMKIHSDFVAHAHAISECSAVVECFESEYWIVFKRKHAGRKADLDFSVRVHGFLP